jgi:hypothetical protein
VDNITCVQKLCVMKIKFYAEQILILEYIIYMVRYFSYVKIYVMI